MAEFNIIRASRQIRAKVLISQADWRCSGVVEFWTRWGGRNINNMATSIPFSFLQSPTKSLRLVAHVIASNRLAYFGGKRCMIQIRFASSKIFPQFLYSFLFLFIFRTQKRKECLRLVLHLKFAFLFIYLFSARIYLHIKTWMHLFAAPFPADNQVDSILCYSLTSNMTCTSKELSTYISRPRITAHTRTHTFTHAHIHTRAYTHIYINTRTCICTHIYIDVCVHTYKYTHMYSYKKKKKWQEHSYKKRTSSLLSLYISFQQNTSLVVYWCIQFLFICILIYFVLMKYLLDVSNIGLFSFNIYLSIFAYHI